MPPFRVNAGKPRLTSEGSQKKALQGRRYVRLEIAPEAQLTFEERGIVNSAGRQRRPAQFPMDYQRH